MDPAGQSAAKQTVITSYSIHYTKLYEVLWDQVVSESDINAPGNLYSTVTTVRIDGPVDLKLNLDRVIDARERNNFV